MVLKILFSLMAVAQFHVTANAATNLTPDDIKDFRVFERRYYLDSKCEESWYTNHNNTVFSICWTEDRSLPSDIIGTPDAGPIRKMHFKTDSGRHILLSLSGNIYGYAIRAYADDQKAISYKEVQKGIKKLFKRDRTGHYFSVRYMQDMNYKAANDKIVDRVALIERTYKQLFKVENCKGQWSLGLDKILSSAACELRYNQPPHRAYFEIFSQHYFPEDTKGRVYFGINSVILRFYFEGDTALDFDKALPPAVAEFNQLHKQWFDESLNKIQFIVPLSEVGKNVPKGIKEVLVK